MSDFSQVMVIIPSFSPPESLPDFCKLLMARGFKNILVINDGSTIEYNITFQKVLSLGLIVVNLPENGGKGTAILQGIRKTFQDFPECRHLVFCDDDGQHSPVDVERVTEFGLRKNLSFALGSRRFSLMPWRSRIGNILTFMLLRLFHGVEVPDTQSGLRFISKDCGEHLMSLPPGRFSFELRSLILLQRKGFSLNHIPIQTIYFNQNKNTRFRAIADSYDVIKSIFKKNHL